MKTSLSTVALGLMLALGCDLDPGSIGDETQGESGDDSAGEQGCEDACGAGEQCLLPPGSCGGDPSVRTCQPMPEACYLIYDPVCGCDGVTYGNECDALMNGASIDFAGECGGGTTGGTSTSGDPTDPTDPTAGTGGDDTGGDTGGTGSMCDGLAGIPCGAGEYCFHEPGVCAMLADATGVCEPIPDACPQVIDPVCGCDGQTYDNACSAALQGVNLASEAECDPDGRSLCDSTGGTWFINSCGHYDCGTPPICAAVIPGCDCGPTSNFADGVGCVADNAC